MRTLKVDAWPEGNLIKAEYLYDQTDPKATDTIVLRMGDHTGMMITHFINPAIAARIISVLSEFVPGTYGQEPKGPSEDERDFRERQGE